MDCHRFWGAGPRHGLFMEEEGGLPPGEGCGGQFGALEISVGEISEAQGKSCSSLTHALCPPTYAGKPQIRGLQLMGSAPE